MLSRFGAPRLSYAQLFSFQVLYSNNADSRGYANSGTFGLLGRKKGDWKRAILEVDFTMGSLFLQDKDRIIMSESFEEYKRYKAQEEFSDDMLVSVRFKSGQWEIMAQNAVEKKTLQHLLECIVHDLGAQEAAESGITKGLVGVDKEIMKYGLVQRRAKTAYKKDERFLLVVPGKLLLFKGMDIVGKHVRFVTSLLGASTHLVYGQLEFEIIVPDSKSLNLLTLSAEELTGWIGAIEKSSLFAIEGSGGSGSQNLKGARADKRRDLMYRNQENPGYTGRRKSESSSSETRIEHFDDAMQESQTNRSKDYDGDRNKIRGNREYWNQRERDQRSPVYDGYAGDHVEPRGFRGNASRPDNDRRAMHNNEIKQSRESNMQLPRSLEQGRERDQIGQDGQRIDGASIYPEFPGTSSQSVKPVRSPQNNYPDQQATNNPQLDARCLNGERHSYTGAKSQEYSVSNHGGGSFERRGERNAGKGVVYYTQPGFDRGNAEYLPGNTIENKGWDGMYGLPVEARNADEEHRVSKLRHWSSMPSASMPAPLNQQLAAQTNLRNFPERSSENRRGSRKGLDKMTFYMNLYRRELVDSSTQT